MYNGWDDPDMATLPHPMDIEGWAKLLAEVDPFISDEVDTIMKNSSASAGGPLAPVPLDSAALSNTDPLAVNYLISTGSINGLQMSMNFPQQPSFNGLAPYPLGETANPAMAASGFFYGPTPYLANVQAPRDMMLSAATTAAQQAQASARASATAAWVASQREPYGPAESTADAQPSPYNLRPRDKKPNYAVDNLDEDEDEDMAGPSGGASPERNPEPIKFEPTSSQLFCVVTIVYLMGLRPVQLELSMATFVAIRLWLGLPTLGKQMWAAKSLVVRRQLCGPLPMAALARVVPALVDRAPGVLPLISCEAVFEALRIEGRTRIDFAAFEPLPEQRKKEFEESLEEADRYFKVRERLWKVRQHRTGCADPLPPAFTPEDQALTTKDLLRWLNPSAQ